MQRLVAIGQREEARERLASVLMHVGWWSALTFTFLAVSELIPRPMGTLVVLLIGVAIAASLARSRMRLADTISQVFETGLTAAVTLQSNILAAQVCIVETDLEGEIAASDCNSIIGWSDGDLKGKNVEDLIPDRCLRTYQTTMKEFHEPVPTQSRISGVTLYMPAVGEDGEERATRLTIARLGDTMIFTFVPTGRK